MFESRKPSAKQCIFLNFRDRDIVVKKQYKLYLEIDLLCSYDGVKGIQRFYIMILWRSRLG